tara:strand:+ start:39 stop:1661 length:1623 start_codon:yes stop_codon:yes gene_type:complete
MDDTGLTDSSGSSQSVTLGNDVSRSSVASKFGGYSMRHVDGSAAQARLTVGIPSLSSGSWTIDGWFRFDDVTTTQKCLIAGSSDFYFGILYSYGGSNKIDVMLGNGTSWNITGNPPSPTGTKTSWSNNTWYHVALVFDGSTYKTYIDGVLDNTFTSSANIGSITSAYLGVWGNNTHFYAWKGYMDEWRVSQGVARWTSNFTPPVGAYGSTVANATGTAISTANTALTAPTTGDICMLIENCAGTATLNTDLKAYVSRNGGTGWDQATLVDKGSWGTNKKILTANNVAFSNSASGTDMRYKIEWANQGTGTPTDDGITGHTITATGDADISATQKKFGNASLVFDGTGDYLSVPDHADWAFGTGDFTIDFWMNISSYTNYAKIFNWGKDGATYHGLIIQLGNGSNLLMYNIVNNANAGSGWTISQSTSTTLNNNTWYHIALVRTGNVMKIFKDGTQVGADAAFTGTFNLAPGNPKYDIGGDTHYNEKLNGYMDEVRVSNTARWTSNFTPPTVAYTSDANTKLLIHGDVKETRVHATSLAWA